MEINFENFDLTQPIILGLSGRAGSGKTSVAESIVPKGAVHTIKNGAKWDHIFYALPIYELASIKKNIIGHNSVSRKLYSIHNTLYDLYGGSPIANIPGYYDMVKMVERIYDLPIEAEGVKPRKFLQECGDICKEFNADCFAEWGIRKSKQLYRQHTREDEETPVVIIVSDVRFKNEAEVILREKNGIVIIFDASEEVLRDRIVKRDGKEMSSKAMNHSSEQGLEDIKNLNTYVINTDNMSVEEQVMETLRYLQMGPKVKNYA